MFTITFEIVTPESAENSEAADSGFVAEDLTLREAYAELRHWGKAVSADVWPIGNGSSINWLEFGGEVSNYVTGETCTNSLHIPKNVTASSRLRIARLFGLL